MTTLKKVAEKAGVAISTASYAINGNYDKVSKKTAQKVLKAAEDLNYYPDKVARSLARNKTETIGLFLLERADRNQPYIIDFLVEMMDYCNQFKYDILLFSSDNTDDVSYLGRCQERKVDGAVIFGIRHEDPYFEEIKESDIPIILIDEPITGPKTTYVASYNEKGAYDAVNHLLDHNHEKIIFMGGNKDYLVVKKRLAGYKKALLDRGLSYQEEWILNAEFERDIAYNKTLNLLKQGMNFTAVFSVSDYMALGVKEALNAYGLKVPGDVSVIGFDDIDLASQVTPKLTTVRQNISKIGKKAVQKLIKIINGETRLPPTLIECELIKRDSVSYA